MTPEEFETHKEKIKKVMVDHLTQSVKYPNCSNEQIMGQLKPMWILIEEAGLVLPGMNFQAFCAHAQNQFLIAKVNDMMNI